MNIILLEKINNLGKEGDKIKVKSGYARNFLIPKNKAIIYNIENFNNIKNLNNKTYSLLKLKLESEEIIYKEIKKIKSIIFYKKSNKNNRLFDSIDKKEIIKHIKNLYKELNINNLKIVLNKKIKNIGIFSARIFINKKFIDINIIVKEIINY